MSSTYCFILLLNIFCTFSMTGIIWFVQVVHYPLFASVGGQEFVVYEQLHKKLTTLVVAPLMLVELFSSFLMPLLSTNSLVRNLSGLAFLFILLIFFSTAFIQVPLHEKLSSSHSAQVIERLVFSNWFRTILWTGKSILLSILLVMLLNQMVTGD